MTKFAAFLLVLLVPTLALAQTIAPAPTIPLTTTAVLVAISVAMAALRSFAPSESWAHTKWGTLAVTALGGVLSALYASIQASGLDSHAMLFAVLGAVGSLVAAVNPSALRGALIKSASASALILFALTLSACPAPTPMPTSLDGGSSMTDA